MTRKDSVVWKCGNPECDFWIWGKGSESPDPCPECAGVVFHPEPAQMTEADEWYLKHKSNSDTLAWPLSCVAVSAINKLKL